MANGNGLAEEKVSVEIPAWAKENPFLLKKFLDDCERLSFESQAKKWIDFYVEKDTYGMSRSFLEDLCAAKLKEGVVGPKGEMTRLIFSPVTGISQDLKVLENFFRVEYEDLTSVLSATDSIHNWNENRFLWVGDYFSTKPFEVVFSYQNMLKDGITFIDFKAGVQALSFLQFYGLISDEQKKKGLLTTSLDINGCVIGISSVSPNKSVYIDQNDLSYYDKGCPFLRVESF